MTENVFQHGNRRNSSPAQLDMVGGRRQGEPRRYGGLPLGPPAQEDLLWPHSRGKGLSDGKSGDLLRGQSQVLSTLGKEVRPCSITLSIGAY